MKTSKLTKKAMWDQLLPLLLGLLIAGIILLYIALKYLPQSNNVLSFLGFRK